MEPRSAEHRTILVVDVEGSERRSNHQLLARHDGMYEALHTALSDSGVAVEHCQIEDRGDGALVLLPPTTPNASVEMLPDRLVAAVTRYNAMMTAEAQLRLRLAVHSGPIHQDRYGPTGSSINYAFRLLDAAAFKSVFRASLDPVILVVSPLFFDEVVRRNPDSDPRSYQRISITIKETTTDAWIRSPGGDAPTRPAVAVPRQLPAHTPHFVGRQKELNALAGLTRNIVVISAINGTAGIGKTTLAVHWAHQVAGRLPDGQLYADLRGFDPVEAPMTPDEAIEGFLDALGVPRDGRGGDPYTLYRSLLANRRMLIVLDNVGDTEHVRRLLPGSPSCLTVVTSRRSLSDLVARDGAGQIVLDLLETDEAIALVTRFLGADRVNTDPGAVTTIIDLCGRLPLALTLAAAHAAAHPELPLADAAAELAAERDRLDTGPEADPGPARAVLSWVLRKTNPEAVRLYRLLATQAGIEFEAPAAAQLAGLALPTTAGLLSELSRAQLLDEHLPGLYRFHDLLRTIAEEGAGQDGL